MLGSWALGALLIATPLAARAAALDVRPVASTDDGEEFASGSMYLTSTDLELTHDTSDQTIGIRWINLAIPPGATITAAYIQFSAKESWPDLTNLTFACEASDNAVTIGSAKFNLSTRLHTSHKMTWAPNLWNPGETGPNERTPDMSQVVQEVVGRSGWASGNALMVIITGTGHRTAYSWDGKAASSPLLHVEYTTGTPPPDAAPVAHLTVSQLASPALTVKADGSTSTDTDATPIATYHFDFGDGSAIVNTSSSTQNHTYASSGTYTVKLTCTDTGNLTSSQVSQSITVTPPAGGGTVAVYAGYYDTHHPHNFKPKPSIWRTSANTVFVGSPDKSGGDDWDAAAVRVDNLTTSPLSGVVVSVDIGTKHYALWGTNTIPAGYHLVLTQTAFDNFDGSDTNAAGCYSCNPNDCLTKVKSTIPVINVTVNGTTTAYRDVTQQINTGGVDRAGCPYTGTRNDESEDWLQIASSGPLLASAQPTGIEDSPAPETEATASEPKMWLGEPYPNPAHGEVAVHFSIPERGPVKLEVFDVTGRQVRVAFDQELDAGEYEENARLWGAAPGVYFYRLTTHQGQQRRTFVLER